MSIISGYEPNVAGTWGSELKRREPTKVDALYKSTVYKESFNETAATETLARSQKNSYSKFGTIQDKSPMILPYGTSNPHLLSLRSNAPEKVADMYTTTSGLRQEKTGPSVTRTISRMITTEDVPPAIGRSGQRIERGVSTSGLLGEKFVSGDARSTNTLVQRSWMPYDDPAVLYKINGKPEAFMPNDVSLAIGESGPGHQPEVGVRYARTAVLTGSPLSKAGARRAGVFMDDFP